MPAVLILSSAPDGKSAEKIANRLVREKLAACVTMLGEGRSVYRWKNKIEKTRETVLLIKTTRKKAVVAARLIEKIHPYEVPEILTLPAGGSKKYLDWLLSSAK